MKNCVRISYTCKKHLTVDQINADNKGNIYCLAGKRTEQQLVHGCQITNGSREAKKYESLKKNYRNMLLAADSVQLMQRLPYREVLGGF